MARFVMILSALFTLVLLIILPSHGHAWLAKVVSVSDGDTITVLREGNHQVKIRLYGINCPEKKKAFGQKARDLTSALVAGRNVEESKRIWIDTAELSS